MCRNPCLIGKVNVKVKALKAAEAAKREEEKKANERQQRKEALKLERALKLEENNLKQMELEKKKREEVRKKKDADIIAKKRLREEEEKEKKEKKRMRLEPKLRQREQEEKKCVERSEIENQRTKVILFYVSKALQLLLSWVKQSHLFLCYHRMNKLTARRSILNLIYRRKGNQPEEKACAWQRQALIWLSTNLR